MKPKEPVAFATWMLEHLTFGSQNEALSGDLLEEFRRGRSAGWYRRQVASAIGIRVLAKSREYALPLVFSLSWSLAYSALWRCIAGSQLAQTIFERWTASDWTYSTSLKPVSGVIPAILFVWLGFFVYRMALREGARKLSSLQLLRSLSISLNVLLIGLLTHLGHPQIDVTHNNFYSNSNLIAISIPLALSLSSGILSALPYARPHRGTSSLAG